MVLGVIRRGVLCRADGKADDGDFTAEGEGTGRSGGVFEGYDGGS